MNDDKGFLLNAFNNKDLDYGKLAICCALSIKANLKNNNTTVLMDQGTHDWLNKSQSNEILNTAFDNIIIIDKEFDSNIRKHYDSPWHSFKAEFKNQPRTLSYEYSPYNETILIDSDYIIMDNHLDVVWGCRDDILINDEVIDLKGDPFMDISDRKLSKFGIPLYWATLVYFKKNDFCKTFFDLINYIKEEYNYFQFLYGFKKGFYRNDFSFSIAMHIMNGNINKNISSFPFPQILTSYQKDGIAKLKDNNEIIFLSHKVDEPWIDTLVNIKNRSVHIMNKRELLRISDKFIECCMEKIR